MDTDLQKFLEEQEASYIQRKQQLEQERERQAEDEKALIKPEFDKVLPFIPKSLRPYCLVGTALYPVMVCVPDHYIFYARLMPDRGTWRVFYRLTGHDFDELPTALHQARIKEQERLAQEADTERGQKVIAPPIAPPSQSLERIAIALEVLVAHWMEVES